jgi:hypothetical protein
MRGRIHPSITVNIQPALNPLPSSRPLIVLIQLNDYIPQELSTTPSTVCFPPNAKPTRQSVQRAIHPLKTTVNALNSLEGGANVALLRESGHIMKTTTIIFYSDIFFYSVFRQRTLTTRNLTSCIRRWRTRPPHTPLHTRLRPNRPPRRPGIIREHQAPNHKTTPQRR